MSIFYFPKIAAADYESFRRILKDDIPDTFDMWTRSQDSQKAEHILKWGADSKCVHVEVDANEFAAYCRATGNDYTPYSLRNFLYEKGSRKTKEG